MSNTTSLRILSAVVISWKFAARAQECYELRPEPARHHFVLVVDRSGSMAGTPLEQATAGARAFVEQLQPDDRAAVVAFDSRVEQIQNMTRDRRKLKRAVEQLRPGGATRLYDAVARAAGILLAEQGARIVVFLTDGADTGSRYTVEDLEGQSLSEGIFIYGIGLGEVDQTALERLSQATGGHLELASEPQALEELYQKVLQSYYQDFAQAGGGAYAIRSLPKGLEVRMDGRTVGKTPVKLDRWPPGEHEVEVGFKRGSWRCRAPAVPGQRTFIDAREADLGYDLWVVSRPHGAAVFLDDAYVGQTGRVPVDLKDGKWARKVRKDERHLRIPLVPPGPHELRLLALPDFDFGPEQEIALKLEMGGRKRVLMVDILRREAQFENGTTVQGKRGMEEEDPFEALDEEMEKF